MEVLPCETIIGQFQGNFFYGEVSSLPILTKVVPSPSTSFWEDCTDCAVLQVILKLNNAGYVFLQDHS